MSTQIREVGKARRDDGLEAVLASRRSQLAHVLQLVPAYRRMGQMTWRDVSALGVESGSGD